MKQCSALVGLFRTIPLLTANCCRVGYLFWAIIEVLKKILIKPFSDSLAWVHFRSPWYKITYFSNQGLIDLQQSIFWIIGPFLNYFCNTQWIQIFHNIFLYIFIIRSMILRVTFFWMRNSKILLGFYYKYWSYYTYCLIFFLIESIISTGRSQWKSIVLGFILLIVKKNNWDLAICRKS